MTNPNEPVSSKIQGMQPGNPTIPKQIGVYRYHIMFDDMDTAWKLIETFAPKDNLTIVTTTTRPNMYLVYDPTKGWEEMRSWSSWSYNEYVVVQSGYFGEQYYLFGSGKVFHYLPTIID